MIQFHLVELRVAGDPGIVDEQIQPVNLGKDGVDKVAGGDIAHIAVAVNVIRLLQLCGQFV